MISFIAMFLVFQIFLVFFKFGGVVNNDYLCKRKENDEKIFIVIDFKQFIKKKHEIYYL